MIRPKLIPNLHMWHDSINVVMSLNSLSYEISKPFVFSLRFTSQKRSILVKSRIYITTSLHMIQNIIS